MMPGTDDHEPDDDTLRAALERGTAPEAVRWFGAALARVAASGGTKALAEALPALARRTGRGPSGLGTVAFGEARALGGAWRTCDLAGFLLIDAAAPAAAELVDLFRHGDLEERTIVLRALTLLPVTAATVELLDEAQRTNTLVHFEAAVCDSNLLARAAASGPVRLDRERLNRLLLKTAFVGLPLVRLLDVERHANEELSRMLQDLATEREAAGRAVWPDTCRLIARAPIQGSLARIAGGLEHGDDRLRAAAAEALAALPAGARERLEPFARERAAREPRPAIRELLDRALDRTLRP